MIEQLNEGLVGKLTLISAPAGFGKTTLVSEWLAGCERPVAWLSLDGGDNDPASFLTYLVAALQTIAANIGKGVLAILQSPQPPPIESILIALLNEIATVSDNFILVLDDYHTIDSKPVDEALTFLLEHLPPQIHLVIATREDPPLPRARLQGEAYDRILQLYRLASDWYEENEDPRFSVEYALKAKDTHHAAFLVEKHLPNSGQLAENPITNPRPPMEILRLNLLISQTIRVKFFIG